MGEARGRNWPLDSLPQITHKRLTPSFRHRGDKKASFVLAWLFTNVDTRVPGGAGIADGVVAGTAIAAPDYAYTIVTIDGADMVSGIQQIANVIMRRNDYTNPYRLAFIVRAINEGAPNSVTIQNYSNTLIPTLTIDFELNPPTA